MGSTEIVTDLVKAGFVPAFDGGYVSATGVYRYEVTLKLYRSTSGSPLQASYPMAIWRNSIAAPATYTRYPGTNTCWTLDTLTNRNRQARIFKK